MHKKKKNFNKQNYKNNKTIPLVTVPSFNTTQQVRIPTLSCHQLKSMIKSIELKKTTPVNPYKKSQTRKSGCRNNRINTVNYPSKFKSIMLSTKQLKNIHQKSQSNSKSPISRKSKSSKKYLTKKSVCVFQTNPNSKTTLNFKLKKTIKQLEGNTFCMDEEDSLLPIKTSSDIINNQQFNEKIVSPLSQDCVDIDQLRKYCQIKADKNTIELSHKYFNQFKQHRAALKIQRAWKRFRTKRLVERYVFLSHFQEEKDNPRRQIFQIDDQGQFSPFQNNLNSQKNIVVPPLEISNIKSKDIVHNSKHLHKQQYQKTINRLKTEQLQKWDQIIQMISSNKNKNPQELQTMLQKLAQQSKVNKEKLQVKTKKIIQKQKDKRQKARNKQLNYLSILSNHSSSKSFQQFNSQKYIQFLDGDLYFKDHSKGSISNHQLQKPTISKRKQQMLFQALAPHLSKKIGTQCINRSESMKELQFNSKPQRYLKSSLQKSSSLKILKGSISSMKDKNIQQISQPSQINLDILTKQFLQGSNFCNQNFDMFYSQQKLKLKLAELNKMKQQESQQSFHIQEEGVTFRSEESQPSACEEDEDYLASKDDFNEDKMQMRRSNHFFQLQIPKCDNQIRIQQQKIASQQSIPDDGQYDACCAIIQNALLIEVFQDIAKSSRILQAFKAGFIAKEVVTIKKKKGFPTSKAQITKFLQEIISYLQENQPYVFKNLQISTGPSALEMLRFMHQQNQEQVQENTDDGDDANVMVIPNRIFDDIWHIKQQTIVVHVPKHFDQENAMLFKYQLDVLKNLNKIFFRSMFDTFNQCLDCERNFGLYGKPFPWKRVPSFYHQKSQNKLNEQIEKARKRMMDISLTYCGLIIEKQEMVNQINEEYVKQVHQDRLSRMLANDLFQSEERWIFYDDEQTEILVEVSHIIFLQVVKESIEKIVAI